LLLVLAASYAIILAVIRNLGYRVSQKKQIKQQNHYKGRRQEWKSQV
jgi:hypothetical protein